MKFYYLIRLFFPLISSADHVDDFLNSMDSQSNSNSGNLSLDKIYNQAIEIQKETDKQENISIDILADWIKKVSEPTPYSHCYNLTGIDQAECKNSVDRDSGSGNISISNCNKLQSDSYYFCLSDIELKRNNLENAARYCENMQDVFSDIYFFCKSKVEVSRNNINLAEINCRHIKISIDGLFKDCFGFIKITKENIRNKQQEIQSQRLREEQEKEDERKSQEKEYMLNKSIERDKNELKQALNENEEIKDSINESIKEVEEDIKVFERQMILLEKSLSNSETSKSDYAKYSLIINSKINDLEVEKNDLLDILIEVKKTTKEIK